MNHDATHCMDYGKDCPKDCYRAMLTRDLERQKERFVAVPLSWSHFKGTAECKRGDGEHDTE